MTIKGKTSLLISISFTILFTSVCAFIIHQFTNFRKEEFKERLHEKAINYVRLLVGVKEINKELLRKIDQNSINKLYEEKTLIFDSTFHLIFSSLDDTKIQWSTDDLIYLKKHGSFIRKNNDTDIYGLYYDSEKRDFYIIVSAKDTIGQGILNYLNFLIVGVGIFFIILTWIISFLIVKRQIDPLDKFTAQIKSINNLNEITHLSIPQNSKNEIHLISKEFNYMINRISEIYQKQKEFTSNASHEFRTPLARITAQLENQINVVNDDLKIFLRKILIDINQLKELIDSLLLLSKIDTEKTNLEIIRIDECLYDSIEKAHKQYPDYKIQFSITAKELDVQKLEIKSNAALMHIALDNLLRNAYQYSLSKNVSINLDEDNDILVLSLNNDGVLLSPLEQKKLFTPFMRGSNSTNHQGVGLGLRIVNRILSAYNFKLIYSIVDNKNCFKIIFNKS